MPKGARRLGGLEDMIISLYAGGMTVRDIGHHLAATLGTEISRETISKVTDAVTEEVSAWQNRPLEAFYPVIYRALGDQLGHRPHRLLDLRVLRRPVQIVEIDRLDAHAHQGRLAGPLDVTAVPAQDPLTVSGGAVDVELVASCT